MKLEAKRTTNILNSFPCWIYKIPDDPSGKYHIPRPFDIIGSHNGKSFAIEVKSSKSFCSFNLNRLNRVNNNESQLDELIKFENQGKGKGFVLYTMDREEDIFFNIKRESRLYIFKVEELIGKTSIPLKELHKLEYSTLTKGVYDIGKVLNGL